MKYIFTVLTFSCGISLASAQLNFQKDYQPIENQSTLPEQYFAKRDERIKSLVASQEILDTKNAEILFAKANQQLRIFFLNGYILYDGPLTAYVRKVAGKTFATNPEALNGINFYVTTFPEANAISMIDGTILVNVGLLNVLDNEAQLAFILAHEVAHFNKKHALKAYKQWLALKNQKDDTEKEKLAYLNLFHSREHEAEADASGLTIMSKSDFDAKQAYGALANIEKEDTSLTPLKADFLQLFSSELYQLDSSLIRFTQKFRHVDSKSSSGKRSVFKGDTDNLSSHPAMDKRKIAVNEILESTQYLYNIKPDESAGIEFNEMKTMAMFESANMAYEEENYFLALAFASELVKSYPENHFIQNTILQSLYWTGYYKDINNLEHLKTDISIYNRSRYWLIAKMMNKAESGTIKKMAYGYAKKMQKAMEKNDDFNFYTALAVEQYLGKETANIFYAQYQSKFPTGKHIVFVNEKTQ